MTLFKKPISVLESYEFSAEENGEIYDLLKQNKTPLEIKQYFGYKNTQNQVERVWKEIRNIEAQVNLNMDDGKTATLISLKSKNVDLGILERGKETSDIIDDIIEYATIEGTFVKFREKFNVEAEKI